MLEEYKEPFDVLGILKPWHAQRYGNIDIDLMHCALKSHNTKTFNAHCYHVCYQVKYIQDNT